MGRTESLKERVTFTLIKLSLSLSDWILLHAVFILGFLWWDDIFLKIYRSWDKGIEMCADDNKFHFNSSIAWHPNVQLICTMYMASLITQKPPTTKKPCLYTQHYKNISVLRIYYVFVVFNPLFNLGEHWFKNITLTHHSPCNHHICFVTVLPIFFYSGYLKFF